MSSHIQICLIDAPDCLTHALNITGKSCLDKRGLYVLEFDIYGGNIDYRLSTDTVLELFLCQVDSLNQN